jgi:hypothetical protein
MSMMPFFAGSKGLNPEPKYTGVTTRHAVFLTVMLQLILQ